MARESLMENSRCPHFAGMKPSGKADHDSKPVPIEQKCGGCPRISPSELNELLGWLSDIENKLGYATTKQMQHAK